MSRLAKNMVEAVIDMLDEETTEFTVRSIMRRAYPKVPIPSGFRNDGVRCLRAVIRLVEKRTGIDMLPLTQFYFQNFEGGVEINSEKMARRCLAGAGNWDGRAIGFRVRAKDFLTAVYLESRRVNTTGQLKSTSAKTTRICAAVGTRKAMTTLDVGCQRILSPLKQLPR